jgi:hypothetical protein
MQEQELGAFCWKRVRFQDLVYYKCIDKNVIMCTYYLYRYISTGCMSNVIFLRYKVYNYS